MKRIGRMVMGAWAVVAFAATSERPAVASADDAVRTLGFEDASLWNVPSGVTSGTTSTRTQGSAALTLNASGYTVLTSRLLGPLGQVLPTLSFDLKIPDIQPVPPWRGAVQLFVSVPSQNLYNAYLGQVELTGQTPGVFHKQNFTVPSDVLQKLRATYSDLTFSIALNVPSAAGATYVLDNFEVSGAIPPNSTVGAADRLPILGFETPDGWQLNAGQLAGPSSLATQGNFSLGVQPQGYAVLTSKPMPSIGPIDSPLTFDLRMPPEQPNPGWRGAVQLFVSIPSQGVYNAFLGQQELTPLPLQQFSTLQFPVPANLVPALNASYTDLQFSIAFNVPSGATGTYNVDNFRVGALTTPPAVLPHDMPIHRDLVGLVSSGVVHFGADGESAAPPLTLGAFYVEERDPACVPSSTRACRFIVHTARFHAGSFHMVKTDFAGVSIVNQDPFEVVLGGNGPSSLSTSIPSNVLFAFVIDGQNRTFSAFPGSASTLTISNGGAGMISMSAQLTGKVDGHDVNVAFSAVADTPLANRPPSANAGPDQSVSSASACAVDVTLNGSGTSDPDGNLLALRWAEGNVSVGASATAQTRIRHAGPHTFSLLAIDRFGSSSRDDVVVNVNLPPSCPH
jgi:hypothetical protein